MAEENAEIARASWEAWERGDLDALFARYDPAIVWDLTRYGPPELSGIYHGHDGVRQFFRIGCDRLRATTPMPWSS